MSGKSKIRVLLAKPGLDGHERGIMLVATALRDAGMEVIYLGLRQTPATIAQAAVEEDVDIVGLSSLADAHRSLAPRTVAELAKRGRGDIPLMLGGFIQPEDIPALKKQGIDAIFGIGTRLDDVVQYVKSRTVASRAGIKK